MPPKKNIHLSWKSFIDGDDSYLKVVFEEYYKAMVFTSIHYLKDEEKAKDTVNEIFLKMLEMSISERKQLLGEVDEKLSSFLKVLVKNKSLDLLKVEKNRKAILTSIQSLFVRSSELIEFTDEIYLKMLDILPYQQRIIFDLHLRGFSNEEISEQLSISYNTTRNTLSTAKKKLRKLWFIFID